MELIYQEYTGGKCWTLPRWLRKAAQWIGRYPVAATSILCIGVIVLSHGHSRGGSAEDPVRAVAPSRATGRIVPVNPRMRRSTLTRHTIRTASYPQNMP